MTKKMVTMMMLVIAAMMASAQTKQQLFDFGWQFTHNGKTVTVDLPHDWDIYEGPPDFGNESPKIVFEVKHLLY